MPSSRPYVLRASLVSALAGGAVGFGLGLLVAPDEGRALRRRLAYLLDRWTGQVAHLVDQLDATQEESVARQTGAALVADAREQAERILSDANALMEEVRQRQGLAD